MTYNAALQLQQIVNSLISEVVFGRTHLKLAKAIRTADPAVVHTARTFFGLTHDAHINAALMYAAKLHDKSHGTITIRSALDAAQRVAGTFVHATAENVRKILSLAEAQLSQFERTLSAIEARRNQYLAHLDPKMVLDPTEIDAQATITIDELDSLFVETGNILNDISQTHHGVFSGLELIDADDYENALRLIAEAKCAQADEYEEEFKEPWPHERPQICRAEKRATVAGEVK